MLCYATAGAQFRQGKIYFRTVLRWVLLGSKQRSEENVGPFFKPGKDCKKIFATSDIFLCHEWWVEGQCP